MRRVVGIGASALLIATTLGAWWLRSAMATATIEIRRNVEVEGATPAQLAMARWAVGRFEAADLDPPAVEIGFHGDPSGCVGHPGFASQGVVDICTTLANLTTRWLLLHEMSHVWLDQNVDVHARTRFLRVRGLPSWNATRDPWQLRGYEQAAEIMAWLLGDRILTPEFTDDDPRQLDEAYELLTGKDPPPRSEDRAEDPEPIVRPRRWSTTTRVNEAAGLGEASIMRFGTQGDRKDMKSSKGGA
jgi:hypothetical protein